MKTQYSRTVDMIVDSRARGRERPKQTWDAEVRKNLSLLNLSEEVAQDREHRIHVADPS